MKKIFLLLIVLLMLLTGCGKITDAESTGNSNFKITDETGVTTVFVKAPQRILTLAMSSDAIVMGLGLEDKLVAVNYLADDPVSSNIVKQAERIPYKIKNPSIEEIIAIKPDVIFVYDWIGMNRIENLRTLGLKVIVLKEPATLEDIHSNINTIACSLDKKTSGEQLIQLMNNKLEEIKENLADLKIQQKKSLVLVSLMTSYGGEGCIFDEMCKQAGVINGLSAAGIKNGQVLTKEMLVKINPDFLIMPVYNNHKTFDIDKYNKEFLDDPSLKTMKAIKTNQLFYPKEGYIYNCSQDFVFGVQEIAYLAYGEIFAQGEAQHLRVSE